MRATTDLLSLVPIQFSWFLTSCWMVSKAARQHSADCVIIPGSNLKRNRTIKGRKAKLANDRVHRASKEIQKIAGAGTCHCSRMPEIKGGR